MRSTGDKMKLRHSDEFKDIAAALAKAQNEFKVAKKDKLNPHLKSTYADIKAVRDASQESLSANGLAIVQSHRFDVDPNASATWLLLTTLIHSSGQWFETEYPLHIGKNDAQGFAAATTYARRVSWTTICGIVAEDEADDGDSGSQIETNALGQPIGSAAQEAVNAARRAELFAEAERPKLRKMDVRQLALWVDDNARALSFLAKQNPAAHAELMRVIDARRKSFNPVPLDDNSGGIAPEDDENADRFQRRLDDLGGCTQQTEVDELDASVMEWLNRENLTDLMTKWVVAVSTRKRTIKSSTVTAQKGSPGKM